MSGNDGRRTFQHPPHHKMTSTVLRPLALLSILLGFFLTLISPVLAQSGPTVEVISVDGTITPVMARYIERGIHRAENRKANAVVLEMDTPGGLSSAMDDIIRSILESDVPVIAYVTPRGAHSASAGVYISYASHVSAMAPGTNIGSASPVSIGGDDSMNDQTMARKVTNDAVAKIRNLADFRGRNADWAESAVRDAVNITADEALKLGVIDLISPDLPTLLNDVNGRQVTLDNGQTVTLNTGDAKLDTFKMNLLEQFLQLIADPTIAYLLLSVGALGIFLELSSPGAMVPGIVGALAMILGLFGLGTLPINWTGAILIGAGFVLFFVDIFVASFGLLLISGMACFVIGSYMLIDTSVPGYDGVSRPVIWAAAACVLGAALLIGWSVLRIHRKRPETGKQALLGSIGLVRQPLDPRGMIFINGELWSAILADASAGPLPVDSKVEAIAIEGLLLTVKPAPADTPVTGQSELVPRNAGVIPAVRTERA
jgi:membrane-bound serine protease (ClpP class)